MLPDLRGSPDAGPAVHYDMALQAQRIDDAGHGQDRIVESERTRAGMGNEGLHLLGEPVASA